MSSTSGSDVQDTVSKRSFHGDVQDVILKKIKYFIAAI